MSDYVAASSHRTDTGCDCHCLRTPGCKQTPQKCDRFRANNESSTRTGCQQPTVQAPGTEALENCHVFRDYLAKIKAVP